jgi:hypothetical protein
MWKKVGIVPPDPVQGVRGIDHGKESKNILQKPMFWRNVLSTASGWMTTSYSEKQHMIHRREQNKLGSVPLASGTQDRGFAPS